jgi:ADP-heptose:LPS heptosyltransferase
VLVLRFSSAGDVILTSPAVHALRMAWPDTKIIYAVKAGFAELVRHNPNIDEVVVLEPGEGPWRFSRRLRALKYDALLDLHGKVRSRLLRALLPRTGRRVVWTKRPWRDNVPVWMHWKTYNAVMKISDRYHQAVEDLVGRPVTRGELRHFLAPGDPAAAETALVKAGVDLSKPLLGMSPGANWATKRWPAERFGEIANRASGLGYTVVATGSGGESGMIESVRKVAPHVVNLAGMLSLGALGGTIARCRAFVANDSGPMHMSRALGVPTLTFFGSTDPKQFEFDGHALLFAGVECSPCSFFGLAKCPEGHFRCMLDLSVESAWTALVPLLSKSRVGFVHA